MKKTMIVIVSLLLITMGLFGSSYSSPDILYTKRDTLNPINFCIVWEPYDFYGNDIWNPIPNAMWKYHYQPKLDAAHAINANWIHARIGAKKEIQAWDTRDEHPWFWGSGIQRFDSALKFIQESNMYIFALSVPNGHYNDCIKVNGNPDETIPFSNDLGYYWYWHILAERYDDDGIAPDTTPWGQVFNEFADVGVDYWEICNEPANGKFQSWGGYFEDTIYSTDSNFITYTGDSFSITKFANYIIISTQAIKNANPDAKVIGPATVIPLIEKWDTAIVLDLKHSEDTIVYSANLPSPYAFWDSLHILGALKCFDIISVHGYVDAYGPTADTIKISIDSVFAQLDSLRAWLDRNGYDCIPIWVTEIGWQRHWFGDTYTYPSGGNFIPQNPSGRAKADTILSNRYIDYCEAALSFERKKWLGKTFIWSLCHFNRRDEITDWWYPAMYRPYDQFSGILYNPKPFNSFKTLKYIYDIIIPSIRLVYPDINVNYTFKPGNICTIIYDSVLDNFNDSAPYTTPTDIDSISIRIEYSIDNGTTWNIIVDSLTAQSSPSLGLGGDNKQLYGFGNYQWTIPWISSNLCKVRVIATDPYGLCGISTGDSCFSIQTKW